LVLFYKKEPLALTLPLLGAAAAILFAALLRGFTGFGFALAAVPLASLFLPPRQVVTAVLLMQVAIGLRDCVVEFRSADWRVVGRFVAGGVFGTPLGVLTLAALPQPVVRLVLGVLVALAVALSWRPRTAAPRPAGGLALGAGFASGICNGLAAMAGPPAILYFFAFEPRQTVMRSSLMVFFPLASALALPMVAASGMLGTQGLVLAAAGLPLMILGSWLGAHGFRRFGGRSYRPVASVALLFTALVTIAKGLSELLG
jgi:uncharacterized membrane protein YfcA